MVAENAWKATLGELELQMTKATFNTWLRDARLLASDESSYTIGVRNAYAKDWLENRLDETICRTLTAISGAPVTVRYVVGDLAPEAEDARPGLNGHAEERDRRNGNGNGNGLAAPPRPTLSSNLRNHYTFDTFVVGPSNRLAHAAALSVSENPGSDYNPLFIYGGVGLGKTHLLQAIGHRCQESDFTVCYVSSETFTNELIQAIREQNTAAFREKYRTPDVLLVDDIQFIAGKESTQEEMFHTFNELHSRGKQLILSSDRPPKAMVTLEERLKSRFEWGLMADIQLPDVETRMAILQAKAEMSGVRVPAEVLSFIAQQVRNNIRELEGVLNKVVAYAQITGKAIDMGVVHTALADILRTPDKMTVELVITAVAAHYGVTQEALCGAGRSRKIAFPRQMCMYLARTETTASFPQIGQSLGSRDHSTIFYGYEKIANLVETDSEIRRDALAIKNVLYGVV